MQLKAKIACYALKGDLSPAMLTEIFFMTVLKILILQGFVLKTMKACYFW